MKPTYEQLANALREITRSALGESDEPGWSVMDKLAKRLGEDLAGKICNGIRMLNDLATAPKEVEVVAPTPVVVIEVEGGVINVAHSTVPMRVVILDADTEGADEDRIVELGEDSFYVTDLQLTRDDPDASGVSPRFVSEILVDIDAALAENEQAVAPRG